MEKVELLLSYLNELNNLKEIPSSHSVTESINKRISIVCDAIQEELRI